MKKFLFIATAILAFNPVVYGGAGTFTKGAKEVEPAEPAIAEVPEEPAVQKPKWYVGGALGSAQDKIESEASVCGGCEVDFGKEEITQAPDKTVTDTGSARSTTAMLLAGYEINDFLAIEGRLTKALSDFEIGDREPISFTNVALYLKPQYKFEDFTIYALIGAGLSTFDYRGVSTKSFGLQYGAGASYAITDQLSVFADYTMLNDKDKKISSMTTNKSIDSINAGVIYTYGGE